ncbi:purine catabolism regulator [Prauserella sediminis]|uniref:Purine catabolism regulator n=1 Tax=Prauserella sediminis TaxID=577680 RepID=A0A839Y0E1_9PSEU|nr:PucR family transcriptional regulator [Prauserella sediminis]MBB3665425.1 purine catabolism regulator [Prauserella sediminis]
MYPTVGDVLALPVMRQGGPHVVAGADGLDTPVRWVHVAEIAEIAPLLKGGELVLTTGVALPDDDATLARYVDDLAAVGVAGVVVELVRHWHHRLPQALVVAADKHRLPLVTLSRETRYVTVTETVNGLIVDAQVDELRAAAQVHETFTELTVSGAEPQVVLREVARLTGHAVVLETLSHEVLAYDAAGADPAELLADWQQRSRRVRTGERTGYDRASGRLVAIVGARGRDWGRLVLLCGEQPPHRHVVVAERAASALAVHHLLAAGGDSLERQAHRDVLRQLLATPSTVTPLAELVARAEALHVPLTGHRLIGAAIRPRLSDLPGPPAAASTGPLLRDLAEATALATRRARAAALVADLDGIGVHVLLALSPRADTDAVLRRLAGEVRQAKQAVPLVLAVGTAVDRPADAGRSLAEAGHVASAALHRDENPPGGYHRLDDVRLHGLLHLLSDDDRLGAFARRELGPLLAKDAATGSRLVEALRRFCDHGGNKSAAAAAAHTSRTAYYQQLARIEAALNVSLEDPESLVSLHVALLIHDVLTPSGDNNHSTE